MNADKFAIVAAFAASLFGGAAFAQGIAQAVAQSAAQNTQPTTEQNQTLEGSAAENPQGQNAPSRSSAEDAVNVMIGVWEFSNADHNKVCRFTFRTEAATGGRRVDGHDHAAVAATVVDTTGAGDALAAGFLIGGAELGLAAAARCCARLGAMP